MAKVNKRVVIVLISCLISNFNILNRLNGERPETNFEFKVLFNISLKFIIVMGIVLSKKKILEVIARKGILPVFKFISKKLEDKNLQIQVNLCQKPLFLHQLTHNMTTDCSLNYHFSI